MFPPRRRRRVLAILLGLLLSAVAVELGSRLFDLARGQSWSVDALHTRIEEQCRILSRRAYLPGAPPADVSPSTAVAQEPGTPLLQPYTGWEHLLAHTLIRDDIDYYRSEESRQVYDVCILGGSVAQAFGELGAQHLIEGLRRDPRLAQREVRVHDFGFGAYKQPQMTSLLAYLLALGHAPDAVIEIDGFNEAALGFTNAKLGGHPVYPYLPLWASASSGLRPDWELGEFMHEVRVAQERARAFAEGLRDSGLWRSSALAHLGLARILALRADYAAAYRRLEQHLRTGPKDGERAGPSFDPEQAAVVNVIVTNWEECARTLHGICAERGIDYLHVLQPTLYDPAGKPATENERAHAAAGSDWIEGVRAVYPRLREAGQRLCARGIPFLDATAVFNDHPEDVYVDLCHFMEHGNEILADAIAPAFLERALKK